MCQPERGGILVRDVGVRVILGNDINKLMTLHFCNHCSGRQANSYEVGRW